MIFMQLRDLWLAEYAKTNTPTRIDVLSGLSKMTLDVIGLAGFNYPFDALNESGQPSELNQAFNTVFEATSSFELFALLKVLFPPLRIFVRIRRTHNVMILVWTYHVCSFCVAFEEGEANR